jgi:hypothetical protein
METNYQYSEDEKALGHKMRAITGHTDECEHCGAMVNECRNWPGRTGGTVWEPCKCAPASLPDNKNQGNR